MIQLENASFAFARIVDGDICTWESGHWVPTGAGRDFTKVIQLRDGTFASIRAVYGLFTCPVINGTWSPAPNPVRDITDIVQLENGSFVCVSDGILYTRESLHRGLWVKHVSKWYSGIL